MLPGGRRRRWRGGVRPDPRCVGGREGRCARPDRLVSSGAVGADPLIRADGGGLIAHTLQFDYEIRSPDEAFDALPAGKVNEEMLDLAMHIIKTKAGKFDPKKFDDRYDAALLDPI